MLFKNFAIVFLFFFLSVREQEPEPLKDFFRPLAKAVVLSCFLFQIKLFCIEYMIPAYVFMGDFNDILPWFQLVDL